ncbi:MAG: hypothetical protein H6610_08110 [Ignavibacteriales bacterium]|nr:hypothetical protein [Ignavibacteriales bacterium]
MPENVEIKSADIKKSEGVTGLQRRRCGVFCAMPPYAQIGKFPDMMKDLLKELQKQKKIIFW